MTFNNKTILLTGGTGSFGQKFAKIILRKYKPKSIRIFSRGEFLQWEMEKKFNNPRLRFLIGDVRDKDRVYRAMKDVDVVVHAAALKHIPVAEYNPIEAVRTNTLGAVNIIDAAIDNGVERAIFISSDKAANPINLYGATKLCGEKLFIQANSYSGGKKTKFSCVRYGNVIGSRGSVVPLFFEQKKKGVLTITDKRMTRFWLTLDQGISFVIKCIGKMKGGEIFIPRIPSMKITDLAEVIAPEAKKKLVGIRPSEKLHEVLLTENETNHSREFQDYFLIEPEYHYWRKNGIKGGKKLKDGFSYASDNNGKWLSREQMKKMIKDLEIEK
ncbi:UDP-N-acetylglucosamine 4,6-dehydratase (inverting) [Patescibacteria group bacterium]